MPGTYTMSLADDRRKRKGQAVASSILEAERIVSEQVPPDRRQEILEYLKLFGYNPERTIIQAHIPGYFNKNKGATSGREAEKRQAAAKRYGGTTFVIVGRTHDPTIVNLLARPKKKPDQASPGYVGYLSKGSDSRNRAPHEILPLDFTPIHFHYPDDWRNMFAAKGFMLALHVPTSFAKHKNKLTRELYRIGKITNVKQHWDFLDELGSSSFEQMKQATAEDPMNILKIRLAKGEITKTEYEKLRQTLSA